jgi:hypothetical protein
MSDSLLTKRALLIAPRFFGYELEIATELSRHGFEVDLLPDRPFENAFFKAVMRLQPELGGHQASDRYFAAHLKRLNRSAYSIILVIQGEGVTPTTLAALRANYPSAKLVFYTWDSIENKPFFVRNLRFYDRCSTFDPTDAKKFGMLFRPLFYSQKFERMANIETTYDLSFIGTIHSDRYHIVQSLVEQLPPEAHSFIYLYLQAPWMYDLRRLLTDTLRGAKRHEFHNVPLSKDQVHTVFFGSRAIIDIEHPKQRGATMRTFECIGSQRKMITTNQSLQEHDFYDSRNIRIINRQAPILDMAFLQEPYVELPAYVRKKYTLNQWIEDVCGLED